jgi:hypothetical protein
MSCAQRGKRSSAWKAARLTSTATGAIAVAAPIVS